MNAAQILARWRAEIGDTSIPYQWSDADGYDYLNDAQNEACRRSRLLVDSTTENVCRIDYEIGESVYPLDSRVLLVRKIRVEGQSRPLDRLSWRDLDESRPGWESHAGNVTCWVQDVQSGAIRLYRIPEAVGVLWLTVVRLPISEIEDGKDEPEIAPQLHRGLIHWMKYRAYSHDDTDKSNSDLAEKHLKYFEREFGPPVSASEEDWAQSHESYDIWDGGR